MLDYVASLIAVNISEICKEIRKQCHRISGKLEEMPKEISRKLESNVTEVQEN
jgi:hypothetical protein